MSDPLVFGFDIGTGSLGLAVRKELDIHLAESLLIDSEVGSLAEERKRRRAFITRTAKKSREVWLWKIWQEIGKEPLYGQRIVDGKFLSGDPRLEREFPEPGDDTVYNSALLRIKLIEGEKLEDWQIYKAIRSAFQRRGYDERVPWAHKEKKRNKAKASSAEEKEFKEKTGNFGRFLGEMSDNPQHHFPCYLDAWRMGLWNPQTGELRLRLVHEQNHPIQRARNTYIPSRDAVEKELTALLENAAKQIPQLRGKEKYILYGEAERPYAHTNKREGVMGQKVPRFENRVVGHCCLIPRFKACRADYLGNYEAVYLLKLRNLIYDNGIQRKKLNPEQMREWYEIAKNKVRKKIAAEKGSQVEANEIASCFKITKSEWKKWLEKNNLGKPSPQNDLVEPPKTGGRTRFSKVALKLVKDLLLSGKSPRDFREETLKQLGEFKTKLREKDLDFLLVMENDWEKIHIPALDLKSRVDYVGDMDTDTAVKKLIGSCHNPLIRHRCQFFDQQLLRLLKDYGRPDRIVMEFIREDFLGKEAKKRYTDFHEKRKKEYDFIGEEYKELLETMGDKKMKKKKLMLLQEQKWVCPYTGNSLCQEQADNYDFEHIIPQAYGGDSSMENLVITEVETNRGRNGKNERLPYEFLHPLGQWEAFKERVNKMYEDNKKKLAILTSITKEEALEVLNRKKALNETSEIAVLTRSIAALRLGWEFNQEGEKKRIHVVSGGLVAKVRRRSGLNRLLGDGSHDDKKIREDQRHHALDAMVICFLSEWYRSGETADFFRFPKAIQSPYKFFKEKLDRVYPQMRVYAKPALGETIYRKISVPENLRKAGMKETDLLVYRKNLVEFLGLMVKQDQIKITEKESDEEGESSNTKKEEIKNQNNKPISDNDFLKIQDRVKSILDIQIQERIRENLERMQAQGKTRGEIIDYFTHHFRQSEDPNSPLVVKVTVRVGDPKFASDLNKNNQQGQYHRGQYYVAKSVTGEGTRKHGFYLGWNLSREFFIRAIEPFESPLQVKKELLKGEYEIWENQIIRRGMWIQIYNLVKTSENNEDFLPGYYQIVGFGGARQMELRKPNGYCYKPIAISRILEEGQATLVK